MEEWEDLITDHNYEYRKDVIIGVSGKEKNDQKLRDIRFVRDKLLRLYADDDIKEYVDSDNFMDIILWLTRSEVELEAGGE